MSFLSNRTVRATCSACALILATTSGTAQKFFSIATAPSPDYLVAVHIQSGLTVIEPIGDIGMDIVDPRSISIAIESGKLFVSAPSSGGYALFELDPNTGAVLSSVPIRLSGAAVPLVAGLSSHGGHLVVSYRDPAQPTATSAPEIGTLAVDGTITAGPPLSQSIDCDTLTVLSNGDRMVLDTSTSTQYRVSPAGTVSATAAPLTSAGYNDLTSVRGDRQFALDLDERVLDEFDANGTLVTVFGGRAIDRGYDLGGLETADLLPAEPPKFYCVDDANDQLVVIDPATGAVEVRGALPSAIDSTEISLTYHRNQLYLLDASGGGSTRTTAVTLDEMGSLGSSNQSVPITTQGGAVLNAKAMTRASNSLHVAYSTNHDDVANAIAAVALDGQVGPPQIVGVDVDALATEFGLTWVVDRDAPSGSSTLYAIVGSVATAVREFPGAGIVDLEYTRDWSLFALDRASNSILQIDWRGGLPASYPYPSDLSLTGLAEFRPTVAYRFEGEIVDGRFGVSVNGAGDVNGDGFDDIVVGADFQGFVRVFSGIDGAVLFTAYGDQPGQLFGVSVDGAGDTNGDGLDDIVVGASNDDTNGNGSGAAHVLSGADGSTLFTLRGDYLDQFGGSVSGAGDVNGDGFGDIVVGAEGDDDGAGNSGSASVFSGLDGSLLYRFDGVGFGSRFGHSVDGAGDVDGDGFDDVIAGSNAGAGYVTVYSGADGSVLHAFYGATGSTQLGESVGGAGDVNGDGFDDLITGSPRDGVSAQGVVRVISGVDGTRIHTILGLTREFGFSASGAGDVNGDGFDDFVAGTRHDAFVHVYSGLDGTVMYTLLGDDTSDKFGGAVSGAGDVDGDGLADLIVGAKWITEQPAGSAMVYTASYLTSHPAFSRERGIACLGSGNRLPQIGLRGRSRVGTTPTVTLHGASIGAPPVTLAIGNATALPLDVIGGTGCTLYANPFVTIPLVGGANGMASLGVPLPNVGAMAGLEWEMQWFVTDLLAPRALPISASDALRFVIGM